MSVGKNRLSQKVGEIVFPNFLLQRRAHQSFTFYHERHVVFMVYFTVRAVSLELDVAAHGEKFEFNLHCLPHLLKTSPSSK